MEGSSVFGIFIIVIVILVIVIVVIPIATDIIDDNKNSMENE